MGYAYYQRNNSYSRSYNAAVAESEGRFPLTRAAQHLGLSPDLFKRAVDISDITTSEWHHVGKYANQVYYWDTVEIANSLPFWKAVASTAKRKHVKEHARKKMKSIYFHYVNERLSDLAPQYKLSSYDRRVRHEAAFNKRCDKLHIYPGNRHYTLNMPLSTVNLKQMSREWQQQRHIKSIKKVCLDNPKLSTRLTVYKKQRAADGV